jgi:signal transduction histidine kinase/ActR/RegA family two-component response regulator
MPLQRDAQLERALDAGRIGTWQLDLTNQNLALSVTCKSIFGLPPDADVTLEEVFATIHPDDLPRVQLALDEAIAGSADYDIEYRIIARNTALRWLHAHGARNTERGYPNCLSGVVVDITRSRRAEALAVTQNALLERVALGHPRADCLQAVNSAIESLHPHVRGCFVLTDPERTRIVEAVAPFPADVITRLFDLPLHQPAFCTCTAAIFHSRPFSCGDVADNSTWDPVWREGCLSQDVRATYSVPVLRPEDGVAIGSFCLCLEEARPLDEWEQQIAVFGSQIASMLVERDRVIDTLQQRESELASELADARSLHEVSVELIAEHDDQALHTKIIDTACAIMHSQYASLQMLHGQSRLQLLAHRGFSTSAAAGWKWVDASHQTACGQALNAKRRVIYPDVRLMTDTLGPDLLAVYEETGIVAIQTTPLQSRTGRVVGMLSTHWSYAHDPSEHELRLIDILARIAADLIERRQTELSLREGDRRKDEFLAMLGHELRNPLAPLRNCLHILRMEGASNADDRALYDIMDRQMTQLVRLVDDLLEISRITRGRIELRRRHVALSDIVTTAVETSQPLLDAYAHRFDVDLPAEPIVLDVDPIRVAQVLSNLLNNAAKYTPAGGKVTLRARRDGDNVRISVIDNGAGIDLRQQSHIFDLFTQCEHTRDQSRGGLGIGLTLVRDLVQLHGGEVSVHSMGVGEGSEFVVQLPLPDTHAAVQEPSIDAIRESEHPRRILIVDDNREHADSLAHLLRLGRHQVNVVYESYDALSVFTSVDPDVVLLDLGMPGMDGYELCRRIRATPAGREALILAVTGWGQQTDRERSAESGFDGHLVKPVSPHEILERLELQRVVH